MNMSLDDQLYCLQRTRLPEDLAVLLRKADKHFLQESEAEAESVVSEIERECHKRGIQIHSGVID